jgi:hypothetical protein
MAVVAVVAVVALVALVAVAVLVAVGVACRARPPSCRAVAEVGLDPS